jgi:hypothetical protein
VVELHAVYFAGVKRASHADVTVREDMILRPKPLFGVSDPALGLEVR